MKLTFAIGSFLLLIAVSCKKSNDQPVTPPIVTDTTKTPIVKVDTSTLLKSSTTYYYDASGAVINDSSYMDWKWDDQRRIIQNSSFAGGHVDTFQYTYFNDHYAVSFNVYENGSPSLKSNYVYYLDTKDRPDSLLLHSVGYGLQAGQIGTSATYYYYNQNGQDSLEKSSNSTSGGPIYKSTLNYYYTGQNLDSTIARDTNGQLSDVSYYSDGNHTVDNWYYSGVQAGTEHLTYSDIPSAGLYVLFRNSKLVSNTTSMNIPSGTTYLESETYQMDAANRVMSMLLYDGGKLLQKQVFTYY